MNEIEKEILLNTTSFVVRFFWTAPLYGDCTSKEEKQLLWFSSFSLLRKSYEKKE